MAGKMPPLREGDRYFFGAAHPAQQLHSFNSLILQLFILQLFKNRISRPCSKIKPACTYNR
jgi:hypothetical protein